jgi:hypothetical protein
VKVYDTAALEKKPSLELAIEGVIRITKKSREFWSKNYCYINKEVVRGQRRQFEQV